MPNANDRFNEISDHKFASFDYASGISGDVVTLRGELKATQLATQIWLQQRPEFISGVTSPSDLGRPEDWEGSGYDSTRNWSYLYRTPGDDTTYQWTYKFTSGAEGEWGLYSINKEFIDTLEYERQTGFTYNENILPSNSISGVISGVKYYADQISGYSSGIEFYAKNVSGYTSGVEYYADNISGDVSGLKFYTDTISGVASGVSGYISGTVWPATQVNSIAISANAAKISEVSGIVEQVSGNAFTALENTTSLENSKLNRVSTMSAGNNEIGVIADKFIMSTRSTDNSVAAEAGITETGAAAMSTNVTVGTQVNMAMFGTYSPDDGDFYNLSGIRAQITARKGNDGTRILITETAAYYSGNAANNNFVNNPDYEIANYGGVSNLIQPTIMRIDTLSGDLDVKIRVNSNNISTLSGEVWSDNISGALYRATSGIAYLNDISIEW